MALEFNHLLSSENIDPEDVLILRHAPPERSLRNKLPWIAEQKPLLFNMYQSVQGAKVAKAILTRRFLASFVGISAGKAHFVGMYEVGQMRQLSHADFWAIPEHLELSEYGYLGFTQQQAQTLGSIPFFSFTHLPVFEELLGKLVVSWSGKELSWYRKAEANKFYIHAIHEESAFMQQMPNWDDLQLSWHDLALLPHSWRNRISQWRGIYLIFDREDGKRYVGSAYGQDNLLGRWLDYSKSGHGGNLLLKDRDPKNFSFSILQLLSPEASSEYVIERENSWKSRIYSRAPYGLNSN